jgi:hypothetical protein
MAEIRRVNGGNVIDYMARDYDSFRRSMQELIPDKLPEWTDYESEADFGNVLLQLFAHMGDILSYYQDRIANESFLDTAQTRRSIIHHLNLIGYKLATAAPASTKLRLVVPLSFKGAIEIRRGDAFATKSQKDSPSVRFEYTSENSLIIQQGMLLDFPNDNKKKYYDGIPVEEGRLIKEEVVGVSDGTPNQRFTLIHPRLILRSLGLGQEIQRDIILKVGEEVKPWNMQETLAFSRDQQPDYIIEVDENDQATVVFGDGDFGAIPPKGALIKASYRVGGGKLGNVAANMIQTIVDAPQMALIGGKVTNPAPATGGAERESIDHAVSHAPEVFRSRKRAVTADDYEALALNFKGVGKVRAEGVSFNTVTLYVAPEGGGFVSDVLEKNLLAYFEDKRLLSTVVEVKDVDYVKIFVTARVEIERFYSWEDIKEKVISAGRSLLAFESVNFGQTVYLSKFYEAIEAINGVKGVLIGEFRTDKQPPGTVEETGKIELEDNEIPRIPNDPEDGPDYAGGIKVVPYEAK